MLKTGNKYRIGNKVYEVVIEPDADRSCMEQCDIEDCTANKDFQQFKKDCGVQMCIQLLGIGRCFRKKGE